MESKNTKPEEFLLSNTKLDGNVPKNEKEKDTVWNRKAHLANLTLTASLSSASPHSFLCSPLACMQQKQPRDSSSHQQLFSTEWPQMFTEHRKRNTGLWMWWIFTGKKWLSFFIPVKYLWAAAGGRWPDALLLSYGRMSHSEETAPLLIETLSRKWFPVTSLESVGQIQLSVVPLTVSMMC